MKNFGATGRKTTGFASPAQGYDERAIDFNSLLVKHPAATFIFRLESGDLEDLGVPRRALLVVDRSVKPVINDFAVIRHDGLFLCRLLAARKGCTVFTDGRNDITPGDGDTEIIGKVTSYVKEMSHDFSY